MSDDEIVLYTTGWLIKVVFAKIVPPLSFLLQNLLNLLLAPPVSTGRIPFTVRKTLHAQKLGVNY